MPDQEDAKDEDRSELKRYVKPGDTIHVGDVTFALVKERGRDRLIITAPRSTPIVFGQPENA